MNRIPDSAERRAGWPALLATAALALAVRVVYALQIRALPAFLEPVLDGAAHVEWARGMMAGTWPPAEAFFRAPGYVAWLAAALSAMGDDPARVAQLQIFLGSVTAVLTAALAGRLYGRGAAFLAGAGAALYPTFPFFDGQLLAPFLAVPLTVGAGWLSVRSLRTGSTFQLLAGAFLWSLVAIVRPPLLLAALLLPHEVFWRRESPFPRGLAFAAAGVILMLPLGLTVRNAAVGDPVFLASQGGLNFYLGNNARANGYAATFPDDPTALGYRMIDRATELAEADRGVPLRSADVSRYWMDRAREQIESHPVAWMRLMLKKGLLFLHSREIPNNHDPVLFAEYLPVLRWLPGWSFWAPLGFLGLWMRRRDADTRFAGGVVAAVAVACILFFVNARFRLPAVPFLIVLGAGGILSLADLAREGRSRAALLPVGILAALAIAVQWNPFGIPRTASPLSYVLMAEAESARGEHVRALRWIDEALERKPGLFAARMAQIDLLRRTGQIAPALAMAEAGVQALPQNAVLRNEYGKLLDLSGRPDEALAQFQMALRVAPQFEPAMINRGVALARMGRAAEAAQVLRGFLEHRPDSPEAPRASDALRGVLSGEIAPD